MKERPGVSQRSHRSHPVRMSPRGHGVVDTRTEFLIGFFGVQIDHGINKTDFCTNTLFRDHIMNGYLIDKEIDVNF